MRRAATVRHAERVTSDHDLRHHGDAEAGEGLIDLAVNVRADTPPSWLAERITASLAGLAAYPDAAPRPARGRRTARQAGREVLLTAGAAEAFVLLARALRPRHAVVVHPQFTEPEAALREAGHQVERVLLSAADGFRLDPGPVPEDADLVVVGNPTNPTSVLHPAALVAGWPVRGARWWSTRRSWTRCRASGSRWPGRGTCRDSWCCAA